MALNNSFIRGRDVKAKIRQNGTPIIAAFKSISIEELADEVADDVNGEERSRFDLVINGYRIVLDGYTPDFALLDSFLADTANADAANAPLVKLVQFTFRLRNGGTVAYRASGNSSARSPFKVDAGDRKGAIMQNVGYRFQYFAPVPV